MLLDFWRALGVTAGVFISYVLASYLIDPTGAFATVSANVIMLVVSAVVLAVFSYAYFLAPQLRPSARHGLELAAFQFIVFSVLSFFGTITAEVAYSPIAYEWFFMLAGLVIALGVPTAVGWYLGKKN